MAPYPETIATRAMQASPAWPAVFASGSAAVLWRAAVEALERAGYRIVEKGEHVGR